MLSTPEIYRRYQKISPIFEQATQLMQQHFAFYIQQHNQFFSILNGTENKTLNAAFEPLSQKLFSADHCKQLESIKEQFLFQKFNTELFLKNEGPSFDFVEDLIRVTNKICKLLQTHTEIYKYDQAKSSNQVAQLLLTVDQIITDWDIAIAKYSTLLKLLKDALPVTPSSTEELVEVFYNLPIEQQTPNLFTAWIDFLSIAAEFIANIVGQTETVPCKILQIEMSSPLRCLLSLPTAQAQPFKQFCCYMNVDVLRRDTLLKFSMEVLRLEQSSEVSKTVIQNYHKKLAKQLRLLRQGGSMDAVHHKPLNTVEVMAELCKKLDKFSIRYPELLQTASKPVNANAQPEAKKPIQQEHVGFLTSFAPNQKRNEPS